MNDPVFWAELLNNVTRASGYRYNGVIAGGAPRDYILGLDVKDIDILVPNWPADGDVPILIERLGDQGWEYEGETTRETYHGAFRVFNFVAKDTPIQLVLLPGTFEEQFRTFDHSLTRCYYKQFDGLYLTPEFLRSMHNRVINVWQSQDRDRTIERMDGLVDKLNAVDPGWTHDQQPRRRVGLAINPQLAEWVVNIPNPVLPPA